MSSPPPFGGGAFIADKSAWDHAHRPSVATEWAAALAGGHIRGFPIVTMELLYTAQDGAEFDDWERDLSALHPVPLTQSVAAAAIRALRDLAHRQPKLHRLPLPDALIAAAAQEAGIGVLHYDRHFDRLAEVLNFESRWIAPPGTF